VFVTSGEVDLIIGTGTREALMPTTQVFEALEVKARALVRSAAKPAGYTLGDTTDDELIKLATIGQLYMLAGGLRKGIEPPAAVKEAISILDQLREGKLPPPDLDPSPRDGIGGTLFSSRFGPNRRAQRFSMKKLSSY